MEILYLEPPPERPLSELFKHTTSTHDYVKEVIVRLNNYINKESSKIFPEEFTNLLQKALLCRFECYQVLCILGMVLSIEEFQSWIFMNETEYKRTIMMREIESTLENYICAVRVNGTQFDLIENGNSKEPKENKHETSVGWVVEHLRTVYNSL